MGTRKDALLADLEFNQDQYKLINADLGNIMMRIAHIKWELTVFEKEAMSEFDVDYPGRVG